jgi:hypothetical protein
MEEEEEEEEKRERYLVKLNFRFFCIFIVLFFYICHSLGLLLVPGTLSLQ